MKRKSTLRSRAYSGSSLGWKMNYRREGNAPSKPIMTHKVAKPSNLKKQVLTIKTDMQTKCNQHIKCFNCQGLGYYASKCSNRRIMILRDEGKIECTSETSDYDDMPPLIDDSDVEHKGQVMVIRRALSTQVKKDDVEQQRENIFHARCQIQNKICSMIIDSGSCANIASVILVRKLG